MLTTTLRLPFVSFRAGFVETLRVTCKSNLGKRSGRKTGTGQVEYLGHRKKKCLKAMFLAI